MSADRVVDLEAMKRRLAAIDRRENDPEDEKRPRENAATTLIGIALANIGELWHDHAGTAYATVTINGHLEHLRLGSQPFRNWLGLLYYRVRDKAIGSQATQDALNMLMAQALFDGPEHETHNRFAVRAGECFVDLCNTAWEVVHITPKGWRVVPAAEVPVRFIRSRYAWPLPTPVPGGSLTPLRSFAQMDDEAWVLILAWLVGCFQRCGGRAFLEIGGGQGSGKSTFARLLLSLIDPGDAMTRSMPDDEKNLAVALKHRAVLGLDNVSHIPADMADALCRVSTGGGLGGRALYTDDEEVLFRFQCPVLWTGIVPVAIGRADLADRTITVQLGAIDEAERRTEEAILQEFEQLQPALLGALYDAVATALANERAIVFDRLPRMADFARWVEAAGPVFGWEPGEFLDIFDLSRGNVAAMAVEASAIGGALISLMTDQAHWAGPASDLLPALRGRTDEETRKGNRGFPKNHNSLSSHLRRLQQPLASVGIWCRFERSKHGRTIVLERNEAVFGAATPVDDGEAF